MKPRCTRTHRRLPDPPGWLLHSVLPSHSFISLITLCLLLLFLFIFCVSHYHPDSVTYFFPSLLPGLLFPLSLYGCSPHPSFSVFFLYLGVLFFAYFLTFLYNPLFSSSSLLQIFLPSSSFLCFTPFISSPLLPSSPLFFFLFPSPPLESVILSCCPGSQCYGNVTIDVTQHSTHSHAQPRVIRDISHTLTVVTHVHPDTDKNTCKVYGKVHSNSQRTQIKPQMSQSGSVTHAQNRTYIHVSFWMLSVNNKYKHTKY